MGGAEEIHVLVDGSSRGYQDRVADGAGQIVRELEVYQGGQTAVVTLLPEQVEANLKAGLTAGIQATVDPAERAALGKFRALLRAVRAYLRGVMGTVAGLKQAQRDGKLMEGNTLETLLD